MAKIPEYEQKTRIEAAPVQEAGGAFRPLSQAWDNIATLGNQFAQAHANEIARQTAVELGTTTPGLPTLPMMGETSKVFVENYRAQEYKTAVTKGINMLDRLAFDVLRNPTPKTLDIYDTEYQGYIDELSGNISKENSIAVREQLQAAYLNARYRIESQIVDKAQAAEKESFKQTFTDFGNQIINSMAIDRFDAADQIYRDAESFIDDPYNVPELSLPARNALKKSLKELYEDSKTRNEILKAIRKKEPVEKIIKRLADLPATVENLRKTQVAADTLQNYASAVSAHDNLLINQAKTKMVNEGGLSAADLALLKSQIMPGNFASFEVQVAKFNASHKEQTNAADFMESYAGNSGMLSTLYDTDLDKGFKVLVDRETQKKGAPLSIMEEAQVAQRYDVAVPKFNKKLSGGINSRNAGLASQYAGLYAALARNNPNVVAGVDDKTAVKALAINDEIEHAASPEDAWKAANGKFGYLTPKEIADSKSAFAEIFKREFGREKDRQLSNIIKTFGFSGEAARNNPPPGIVIDFMNQVESNYVQSRDWDKSVEVAKQKLAQRYAETEHNGFKQIQKLPPTKFLPLEDVRRLEVDYINKLTATQIEAFNNPEILLPFHYELDKEFAIGGTGVMSVVPGLDRPYNNPYRGRRKGVNYKGEPIDEPGQFIFMSDQFTDYPSPGQTPSWALVFLPDNKLTPDLVYVPQINANGELEGTTSARFVIPPSEIAKQNFVDKELMKHKEEIQNVIRNMAKMLGQQIHGVSE